MLSGSQEDRRRNEFVALAQPQERLYAQELALAGIVRLIGHIKVA